MSVAEATAAPPTIALAIEPTRLGVVVSVTPPAGATAITLWRVSTRTGNSAFVRGWAPRAVSGAGVAQAHDWEVPLGVEVVYYATATVAGAESAVGASAPLTVDDKRDWLVDLARPTNSLPVDVEGLPELSYDGPVGVHRVLDRRDPVLTTGALWTPNATLSVFAVGDLERQRVRTILGSGLPFLLRTPPEHGVGNAYLGVLGLREQRVSRLAVHGDRRFVVDVVQVARPDAALFVPQAPLSYRERLATWPTYADVPDLSYEENAYTFPPESVDPSPPWPPSDV